MKDNLKILFSVLVVIIILGLWIFLFYDKDSSTETAGDNTLTPVSNTNTSESLNNPSVDKIKQYRMRYNYSGNQDLIIDLMQGPVTFVWEYEGKENFRAMWKTNKNEDIKLIADSSAGPYRGIIHFDAPYTGPYLVEVRSSGGTWSVEHR